MTSTSRSTENATAKNALNCRLDRLANSALTHSCAAALALLPRPRAPAAAQRERPALNITGYVIDAELDTATHHLTATAVVTFTAPANLDVVNFGFHPALKVTKITDETGKLLNGERTADGTIRVTAATPFVAGQTVALDLRIRRHHHRQRRRPRRRPQTGRHSGAHHLPALSRALVPHDRLHDRPLHRRDAHPRAPGHAGLRQRRARAHPNPSRSPTASPATSTTSTGPSPAFPAP